MEPTSEISVWGNRNPKRERKTRQTWNENRTNWRWSKNNNGKEKAKAARADKLRENGWKVWDLAVCQ